MAMWSEVDKRAKRNSPRQCLSDWGMHRDADDYHLSQQEQKVFAKAARRTARIVYRARSVKDEVAALSAKSQREGRT